MKRTLIISLTLLTLIVIVACGVENSSNSENTPIEKVTDSGKNFSIEDLKKNRL
jgi:ABC-type Fe3+-citrate transport system substrate-binding protein|tara:strand:- start:53 stop:214 length:162 start_codon:yes stop_codon:yes gene_type:complete